MKKFSNRKEVIDALVSDFGRDERSYNNTPTNKQREKFWTYNRLMKHYYELTRYNPYDINQVLARLEEDKKNKKQLREG
tara:strand:- start:169 stop:405 length:237 start_codon:yes stop_codon:yes gene_type:complete